MSLFDIEHVIKGFSETAKGAMAAGFDGVEIHGAHGYLISQFLSSYSNKRTDNYGGSVKNRYRFLHEIIESVKHVISDDRLLTVRVSDWGIAETDVSLFGTHEQFREVIGYLSRNPLMPYPYQLMNLTATPLAPVKPWPGLPAKQLICRS